MVFQSTHLHEVWLLGGLFGANEARFQSTHLHEVWLQELSNRPVRLLVSIHTPTWGVTPLRSRCHSSNKVSIHTPTWGVTSCNQHYCQAYKGFNPHTYMRCDQANLAIKAQNLVFQSTHLHEVWLSFGVLPSFSTPVSIHTPTWGVTLLTLEGLILLLVSIHTPTWGVTVYRVVYYKSIN